MKGPGIKDYLQILYQRKEEAVAKGMRYLEVNSKELHAQISPQHATMPTCCQAMYKVLLEGDTIIQKPKGHTGFGSRLTICYNLENMDTRLCMFPSKKRGRPAKTAEEKLAAKKARMRRNTEDLCNLIKSWLSEHGWEYIENKEYIEAHNKKERWMINVQGIKRGRKQTLPVKLSEIMKRMDDPAARYSMAFNDSIAYRRQWNELPASLKERLNISVILADKKGNIVEI